MIGILRARIISSMTGVTIYINNFKIQCCITGMTRRTLGFRVITLQRKARCLMQPVWVGYDPGLRSVAPGAIAACAVGVHIFMTGVARGIRLFKFQAGVALAALNIRVLAFKFKRGFRVPERHFSLRDFP